MKAANSDSGVSWRLIADLKTISHNLLHETADMAHAAGVAALAAAHMEDLQQQLTNLMRVAAYGKRVEEEAATAAPAKKQKGAEQSAAAKGPRHKFGADGTCVAVHGSDGKVCGAVKGRPGRKPAEGSAADVEARTVPLPVVNEPPPAPAKKPIGAVAADKFTAGPV